jgi:hypothetical protein
MVMGGSNVWGQHLGDNRETFSGCLEQCLQAARPGREIQVLNAGVRGYKLYQLLILFQLYGLSYHPDVLVLYINYNDATEQFGPFTYRQLWQMKNEGRWDEVEGPSARTIYAAGLDSHGAGTPAKTEVVQRADLADYRRPASPPAGEKGMERGAGHQSGRRLPAQPGGHDRALPRPGCPAVAGGRVRFRLSAVEPNSKVVRIRQAMKDIAAAQGVDYLPLNDYVSDPTRQSELVFSFDEVHLNKQGHRIVAAEICRYLLDHRLADQPTERRLEDKNPASLAHSRFSAFAAVAGTAERLCHALRRRQDRRVGNGRAISRST